jgi:hypothetical protein
MLFLIPHLFPPARLLEAAAQDLHLPALQALLARGTQQAGPAAGVEAAVCEALGIERQQDWPIAPITLEADGGAPGDAYWLRADPVHLRVMRDRIVLADSRDLALSPEEAAELANAIGLHFGDSLRLLPLAPTRWYLRIPHVPRLTTTPLSLATGCDIDPLLPRGGDAMNYRALLNELQMLLHEHPLNQAREARGALPVNSVWLWGGGTLPAVPGKRITLYANDDTVRVLGAFCNAERLPRPDRPEKNLLATEGAIVLDELTQAGQCGDPYGWREALRTLEASWFAPLLATLRRGGSGDLRLADPISGKALRVRRSEVWKFWRRPRSLISLLG